MINGGRESLGRCIVNSYWHAAEGAATGYGLSGNVYVALGGALANQLRTVGKDCK
ncbi:hypothetical protein [Companilactobacillus ginsenosidimutans]|uniref:hypothetical protein n=1 Tax=Companilactobacillus ginsenosidimutans TaxID=1007676 RepID=UPI000B0947BC|nr:hypothetical protein [Companilactobacillus ginsenosidimutans]